VTGCGDLPFCLFIFCHCWAPVIIQADDLFRLCDSLGSALSFLGLGAPPPSPSWGSLLADGKEVLNRAPWLTYFPGAAIALTVLSLNLFGDGLRTYRSPVQRVKT